MDNELSKDYRFKTNPEEQKFYEEFHSFLPTPYRKAQIVFPSLDGRTPVSELTEREEQIVLNTIQWLGSPVGQGFLERCGYTKTKVD